MVCPTSGHTGARLGSVAGLVEAEALCSEASNPLPRTTLATTVARISWLTQPRTPVHDLKSELRSRVEPAPSWGNCFPDEWTKSMDQAGGRRMPPGAQTPWRVIGGARRAFTD